MYFIRNVEYCDLPSPERSKWYQNPSNSQGKLINKIQVKAELFPQNKQEKTNLRYRTLMFKHQVGTRLGAVRNAAYTYYTASSPL